MRLWNRLRQLAQQEKALWSGGTRWSTQTRWAVGLLVFVAVLLCVGLLVAVWSPAPPGPPPAAVRQAPRDLVLWDILPFLVGLFGLLLELLKTIPEPLWWIIGVALIFYSTLKDHERKRDQELERRLRARHDELIRELKQGREELSEVIEQATQRLEQEIERLEQAVREKED